MAGKYVAGLCRATYGVESWREQAAGIPSASTRQLPPACCTWLNTVLRRCGQLVGPQSLVTPPVLPDTSAR